MTSSNCECKGWPLCKKGMETVKNRAFFRFSAFFKFFDMRLTKEQRLEIVTLHKLNTQPAQIIQQVGCSHSSVDLWIEAYEGTGKEDYRNGAGCKRKLVKGIEDELVTYLTKKQYKSIRRTARRLNTKRIIVGSHPTTLNTTRSR